MGAVWSDDALTDRMQTLLNNIVGRGSVDVRYHGNGIEIYAPESGPSSAAKSSYIVKITAQTDYQTYTADVYGNGLNQTATQTDITLKILQIATGETVPNNTILMATAQTWGTGESAATYFTAEIPRWL